MVPNKKILAALVLIIILSLGISLSTSGVMFYVINITYTSIPGCGEVTP